MIDRFNKDDTCICMLKTGTIEHVLKECVLLRDIRRVHFSEDTLNSSIAELLHERNYTIGIRLLMQAYTELYR